MQSEDMEAQCMMWRKLNIIVEKKELGTPNFKGFMVHKQIGMLFILFMGLEILWSRWWTCFFHLTLSIDKHIKQLIALEFHDQHKTFCYEYKNAMSLKEANLQYATI
jgi:hypothetical protein